MPLSVKRLHRFDLKPHVFTKNWMELKKVPSCQIFGLIRNLIQKFLNKRVPFRFINIFSLVDQLFLYDKQNC